MPSGTLIRPTVWPQIQYTNLTDRTDRADRQRSDSIGRTVLQTVARKSLSHLIRTEREMVIGSVELEPLKNRAVDSEPG